MKLRDCGLGKTCAVAAWILVGGCAYAPADGNDTGDDGGAATTDGMSAGDTHKTGDAGGPDAESLADGAGDDASGDATQAGDDSAADSPTGDDGAGDAASADTGGDSASLDAGEGGPPSDSSGGDAPSPSDASDSAPPADANDAGPVDAGTDSGPDASLGPITFVQDTTATVSGTASSLSVTFLQPPKAGDLIVIAVGWTDNTSIVTGVTDTAGNVYKKAVGPTTEGVDLSQSIYYASGVAAAAGANKITVTFSAAASAVDLRAAEYSGLSASAPLDTTAAASGKSTAASSGNATTTTARELLFGAGMCTDSYSAATTGGFTMRVVTANGDMIEDRAVTATGTYSAGGTFAVTTAVGWVMQLATFR
jgi:hypothetical protein